MCSSFNMEKTVMNFHFPFLSSRAWDGDSVQKLGLCLLERCPPSLTLMNLQRSNRRAARRAVPSGSCMLTPPKSLLEIKNEKIPIRLIEVLEPCPIEDPPVTTFPPSNRHMITNESD